MRAWWQLLVVACAVPGAACGDDLARGGGDAGPATDGPRDAAAAAWPGAVIGGPGDDDVLDLAYAGDLLYVAGYRDGVRGLGNLEPGGDAVGVVTAYARDGAVAWEQRFDTAGADTIDALDVGAADVAVVGRTTAAFPGAVSGGQVDAFVARIPLGGAAAPPLRQLGDARPQHPVAIARDPAGALLIAGYDDVFVEGGAVTAFEDPITARVLPDLTVDWFRRDAHTPAPDAHLAVASTGVAGELFVGGGVGGGDRRGAIVRRLDASGGEAWARRLTTFPEDTVAALALHGGKLHVAGTTVATVGDRSFGGQDVFVAVLDPATGAVERATQGGSTDADFATDLAIAPDGTVYVVGETLGALPGGTAAGSYDLAVVRFAPDGAWTGSWQRGTADDETVRAVALVGDALVLGGAQIATSVPGTTPAGRQDGFVLRVPLADLTPP